MANIICLADGNLADAATWATVDSSALISTSTGTTTLTTADQDSAVFVPGAITVDAIALRLSSIAASPAHDGTLTVTLRNSTDAVDTVSLAYNVAELVANGDANKGGWYLFKLDASYLLHAVDSYIIRLKLSATAGKPAVSFATNGTAANWQHMLRIPGTTREPVAGDDFFVLGELAAAATWTTRTVYMNQTLTTDYGANANESEYTPGMFIGKNGTVSWGISTGPAAATAYILKLSGSLVIAPGGAMNMGSVGAECPRDSSMDLQFDTASSKLYGLYVIGGSAARGAFTMQGLSRTTGKLIDQCKVSSNVAVNDTTINVDTDTGWLLGDEVVIAPTDRTYTHDELKVLTTGNAGASSFTVAAVSYVHSGVTPTKADILLLTRNVRVRALNTTYASTLLASGTMNWDWARITDMKVNIGTLTTGSLHCDYCAMDGAPVTSGITTVGGTDGDFHFVHLVCHFTNGTTYGIYLPQNTATNWELSYVTIVGSNNSFYLSDVGTTTPLTYLTAIGSVNAGIVAADGVTDFGATPTDWTAYCNGTDGIDVSATTGVRIIHGRTFSRFTAWGNPTYGIQLMGSAGAGSFVGCMFDTFKCYGNGTAGLRYYCMLYECQAWNWDFAGLTTSSMAQPIGTNRNQGNFNSLLEMTFYGCTFGVAAGVYAAHTTCDLQFLTAGLTHVEMIRWKMRNCTLGSATEYDAPANLADGSFLSLQRHDQTDLTHKYVAFGRGVVSYEVTTFKTAAPSIKMTPSSATKKLNSGVMRFPVSDGVSCSIQVQVRKNAAYNGALPRLVVLRNDAIGIVVNTAIDTMDVGTAADTWELLSAVAIASPIDNGVVECYVDCDGTAGAVFVDEWTKV